MRSETKNSKSYVANMHTSKRSYIKNYSNVILPPISEYPPEFRTFDARPTLISDQCKHYITSEAKLDPMFTPILNSPQLKTNKKRHDFLDMIGLSRSHEKPLKHTPLHTEIRAESIAVTDFMGNDKYKFFKKTGFSEIYNDCIKNKETRDLIEEKNMLTFKNIMHTDRIREFEIRSPTVAKKINIYPLFEKEKYRKYTDKEIERLDKIQLILDKCDKLYSECKGLGKSRSVPQHELLEHIPQRPKVKKRKLTVKEIKTISKDLGKLNDDTSPV